MHEKVCKGAQNYHITQGGDHIMFSLKTLKTYMVNWNWCKSLVTDPKFEISLTWAMFKSKELLQEKGKSMSTDTKLNTKTFC